MTFVANDSSTRARQESPAPASGAAHRANAAGVDVELADVTKDFGQGPVLANIRLRIGAGEFVAFVGRSGCGKSTLLRLIAGLEFPTLGAISSDGKPVRGINAFARLMFQDARLLPWLRVSQNVAVGQGGALNESVTAALTQVGLAGRASDWPAILSGGQRQRVALARALVSDPELLLLDEPLGALDALTRIEMQALIQSIWQRRRCTAILVTHDIEEAVLLADRVLLLEHGAIRREFAVPLARPRDRTDAKVQTLVREILAHVLGTETLSDSVVKAGTNE